MLLTPMVEQYISKSVANSIQRRCHTNLQFRTFLTLQLDLISISDVTPGSFHLCSLPLLLISTAHRWRTSGAQAAHKWRTSSRTSCAQAAPLRAQAAPLCAQAAPWEDVLIGATARGQIIQGLFPPRMSYV